MLRRRGASGGRRSRRIDVRSVGKTSFESSVLTISSIKLSIGVPAAWARPGSRSAEGSGRPGSKKNRQFVECTGHNSARKTSHLHFVCARPDGHGMRTGPGCKYRPGRVGQVPFSASSRRVATKPWLASLFPSRASQQIPRTKGYLLPRSLFTAPFPNEPERGRVITKIARCRLQRLRSPIGYYRRGRAFLARGQLRSTGLVINLVSQRRTRIIELLGER